ncbi:MAG: prepilin-type N-terminal cleavage/methylation domain-containing protein [Patescibacteria group bacterium]
MKKDNFSIAKRFKRESGAGFTLIELVIAIFILAFATVGVYNAFSTMIVLTQGISNRFTAAYLAQEGLEIIRNMRDTNWIKSQDWKTGLDCSSAACEAYYKTGTSPDSTDFPLEPYSNNGRVLKIDDNGFYNYTSGQDTKIKRKIIITPTSNSDAINVSVLVTWKEKDQECIIIGNNCCSSLCIKAEEYLYNWY